MSKNLTGPGARVVDSDVCSQLEGSAHQPAEALDWPLCTADRRLAHASGPRCTMQLITLPG